MPKMTKKELKAKEEIEALESRLGDMLLGANGPYGPPADSDQDGDLATQLGLDVFGRWVAAMKREFGWDPSEENGPVPPGLIGACFFEPAELHHFETVKGAAERLHDLGARA